VLLPGARCARLLFRVPSLPASTYWTLPLKCFYLADSSVVPTSIVPFSYVTRAQIGLINDVVYNFPIYFPRAVTCVPKQRLVLLCYKRVSLPWNYHQLFVISVVHATFENALITTPASRLNTVRMTGEPADRPPSSYTNSVALSPQANYTDLSTATCQRNLVPNFTDRGVSRGQCGGFPTAVNLSFLDRNRSFSFK
jgi:hypothetical protein